VSWFDDKFHHEVTRTCSTSGSTRRSSGQGYPIQQATSRRAPRRSSTISTTWAGCSTPPLAGRRRDDAGRFRGRRASVRARLHLRRGLGPQRPAVRDWYAKIKSRPAFRLDPGRPGPGLSAAAALRGSGFLTDAAGGPAAEGQGAGGGVCAAGVCAPDAVPEAPPAARFVAGRHGQMGWMASGWAGGAIRGALARGAVGGHAGRALHAGGRSDGGAGRPDRGAISVYAPATGLPRRGQEAAQAAGALADRRGRGRRPRSRSSSTPRR
jgi:hypothetical protein